MTPTAATLPVAGPAATRRAMRALLRTDRRALSRVAVLNGAAAAVGLAGPWLLGRIVDDVGHGGTRIDALAAAALVAAAVQVLLLRVARRAAHRQGETVLARLRETLLADVLAVPVAVAERAGTGDLTARATADVTTLASTVRDAVPDVLVGVVQVLFLAVGIVTVDPVSGLVAVAGLAGIPLALRWYLPRARPAYLTEARTGADVVQELAATAAGARTVEAFGLGRERLAAGDRTLAASWRARMATLRLRFGLFGMLDLSGALPAALVLLAAALRPGPSLGGTVTAALYAVQLAGPLDRILRWTDQLQTASAALARVEGVAEAAGSPPAPGAPGTAVLHGVQAAYPDGPPVLHDVDLVVRPGERIAVVGPSGAGKTTVARLVAGLDTPRRGTVEAGPALLVVQEPHLFLGTVRDNLTLVAPGATGAELAAAVGEAGLAGELLDTDAATLGPADTQRVALARALLADPALLLLDEATSLLSESEAVRIEERLAGGRTTITIAHRLHSARAADRVVVLEEGRVVEEGPHGALLAAGGTYAALWRAATRGPGAR